VARFVSLNCPVHFLLLLNCPVPFSQVNKDTGLIDFEQLQERVDLFKPKLIICGGRSRTLPRTRKRAWF
jgi:glycine/serine hydroxymethyltransferase